jgi:NAD(P)-dependent dehydrogenase (short-subunit alcohol dehydrogenase family)
MPNDLMRGKRGLIMGLANDKSIAWGIARALGDAGAEMAFSYQGEALLKRVAPLAAEVGSDLVLPCDVADMESVDALFASLADRWGSLDFLVHAIGFSDKNELRGRYVDTSRQNFLTTMDISVYSFTAGWADQDAGGLGDRRLPLHPQVERAELAAAPQRDPGGGGQGRPLPVVRPRLGHHGRGAARRLRLPPRRHEGGGRPRHRDGQGRLTRWWRA